MTQTYRTDDFGRWGAGQGFNLTPAQVDINFWDIIERLEAQEIRPDPAAGISHFEVIGTLLYVHMDDDTTILGPYELPYATFRSRGEWAVSTSYSVLDTFTINGSLYAVTFAHTSDATSFDAGANDGAGNDYYSLMIETPENALPTGGAVGQVVQKSTTTDFDTMWSWKYPTGGSNRKYLIQQSSTQDDAEWDTPTASDIEFVPDTSSTLTSTNVADAIEEASTSTRVAEDITYTPSTGSGLSDANVQDALDTLGASMQTASSVGRQTMWIPAAAMISQTTNGAASGSVETTTNDVMLQTMDFDSATQEYAQFTVAMPKSWDGGTVAFRAFWSHAATTTNFGVALGLQAVAIPNDGGYDVAFGTAVYVTDTGGTTNDQYTTDESAAVTVAGTLTYGSATVFRVTRDPANGSDTLAVDARLHGIQLFYTTNASTDD